MIWQPWLNFFVNGIPKPSGSKNAYPYYCTETGRLKIRMVDACKTRKPWMDAVAFGARRRHQGRPFEGPVKFLMKFYMPRPKSHYGTGRNASVLKASAPREHLQKPDLTKLIRCAEDALTGILWVDDSQVIMQGPPSKEWNVAAAQPGVFVTVWKGE